MHPILVRLGPIPIHTYGFLIAIGFLIAVQVIQSLAARSQLDLERIQDLIFGALITGFIGARTVFILTRWTDFASAPLDIFKVWEGGLVFYGGPLFAIPFIVYFLRRHRMPLWRTLDTLVPGLTVAHAFGRIGCLAAGCCYGIPTGTDFGVILNSDLVDPALHGVHLHPTQLYESTALFLLFFGLLTVFRKRRFEGQVALVYAMAYPVIRSVIEVFRGDTIRGFVIDGLLSTSQFISILAFAIAAGFLVYRLRELDSSPQVAGSGVRR